MAKRINCHTHCFCEHHVPERFLPLGLVRLLVKNDGENAIKLAWWLNNINPFSDNGYLDKYANVLRHGAKNTQKEIFIENSKGYTLDFRFVALPMDFSYMKAGKSMVGYTYQLIELMDMYDRGMPIIPFIMATPDNAEFVLGELKKGKYKGVKLYPLMGYYPQDIRLYPIYEYCNQNNIPIITHCTPKNATHFRGSKKVLIKRLREYNPTAKTKGSNKNLCYQFADPDNYDILFETFKNLKIDFAHIGGNEEWERYIKCDFENNFTLKVLEKLKKYEGAYGDISYSLVDAIHVSFLKRVIFEHIDKILFGDDSYMNEAGGGKHPYLKLETLIGSKNYDKITIENPEKFGIKY